MSRQANSPSEFATVVKREAEVERPSAGSLEARASLALKLLAALNVAGVVLAMFSPVTPVSNLLAVTFSSAAAVLAVLYLVEANGLDHRRPWAVAAVRPVLVLLVASGVSAVVIALGGGTMRVPFDGVLAVWALLGPADVTLPRGLARRATLLVSAAGALLVSLALAQPLFGWGGLLDVEASDLDASIEVDCGAPGAGLPESITVSYDWSWRSASPLPNESDIVVIGWTGSDAEHRPLYVIDEIPDSAAGIYSGLAGYPSTTMANEIAAESGGFFRWAIRLGERGFEPGGVTLQLMRPREDPPGPNSVTFTATYIHLGLWRHDAATVICSW